VLQKEPLLFLEPQRTLAVTHEVTIFWPDSPLASELSGVMTSRGFAREPKLVVSYPSVHDIGGTLKAGNTSQVVVVGLTEQRHALELIQEVSQSRPEIVVAAADRSRAPESVIAAMRAGAMEFLAPPFDLQHLEAALNKRPKGSDERTTGRLTAVLPARGGSGASMVAVHLANSISQVSKSRVLLVDFDFQAGSIAFRLGVNPEFTLADALGRIDIVDELWQRLACRGEGFEVLAAPASFKSVPLENLGRLPELFLSAMRTYSHVVVDMPPGMFSASQCVLELADEVYLVTSPEVLALHLARRRVTELLEMRVPKEKIRLVVNRIDSKQSLREKEIEQAVGLPVARSLSNDYAAVSAAALKGLLLGKETDLGRQLHSLACQIAGAEAKQPEVSGWKKLLGL
jgi:pilus assembly protein CpaE